MAAVVDQNMLVGQLKKTLSGAWQEASKVEPKAKGAQLPPGLIGSVARLIKFRLGRDKNGKLYFMFTAVAIEPTNVQGRQFTKLYSLAPPKDDPKAKYKAKTVREKLDDLSNDIQLLGTSTEGRTTDDDLVALIAETEAAKPFFEFNTWSPKAEVGEDPKLFVFPQRHLPDYVMPEGFEIVEGPDESPDESPVPSPEPAPEAARARGPARPAASPAPVVASASSPRARGPARPAAAPAPEPEPEPSPEPEAAPEVNLAAIILGDVYYFTYKGVKEPYEVIGIPSPGFVDIELRTADAQGNFVSVVPTRIFRKLDDTKLE